MVICCTNRHPRLYSTFTPSGTLDMDAWQTLDTSTPLCSVVMPLSWHQIGLDGDLMTFLLRIIDTFSFLVGWVDKLDKPKHLGGSMTVEAAIEFFVDIFAGNFRNFIGDMVFFSELPTIMETENYAELDTRVDKGEYQQWDILFCNYRPFGSLHNRGYTWRQRSDCDGAGGAH
ncbi:hypothetical protein EDC04DRAFT_2646275 [Pisolithus marmoratus]|nr:hypothetical protein EDC04DRAFT_2646275 [Pisolithus marmoratus]